MFLIEFTDEALEYPYDDKTIPAAPGRLVFGVLEEDFIANLSVWNKTAYKAHWRQELSDLIGTCNKVALVVSYDDPKVSSNLEIWRVYRDGETARFQNQILPYTQLPESFEISELSRYIQDRMIFSIGGNKLSEWDVPLQDIRTFLSKT